MSFILDALKKSESERQNRSGAEFSSIPTRQTEPRRRPWLWIIGVLLAVNIAVLLGILFRSGSTTPEAAQAPAMPAPGPAIATQSAAASRPSPTATFEDRIASARQELESAGKPPAAEVSTSPEPVAAPAEAVTEQPEPRPAATTAQPARVPTIDELVLDGTLTLPELRVDMHVYSDDPGRRFVFINMNKYREQGRLDEGPLVREIRPDGVLLEYDGRVFLLPRE